MEHILVATVFSGGELDSKWANIQSSFIENTNDYNITKLAVLPNTVENTAIYSDCGYKTLLQNDTRHTTGIKTIFRYFKNSSEYEYLCLLDSDAWPIDKDWAKLCVSWLNKPNTSNTPRVGVAAIRFENLDVFPHPCIFFIKKDFILNGKEFRKKNKDLLNLLSNYRNDVFGNVDSKYFYPLMRSNKLNLHPIVAGIYNNVFYHHAGGSRRSYKGTGGGYYRHYLKHCKEAESITEELFKDPRSFIDKLKF